MRGLLYSLLPLLLLLLQPWETQLQLAGEPGPILTSRRGREQKRVLDLQPTAHQGEKRKSFGTLRGWVQDHSFASVGLNFPSLYDVAWRQISWAHAELPSWHFIFKS